jgi:phosphate-selective porin OprO and OprP
MKILFRVLIILVVVTFSFNLAGIKGVQAKEEMSVEKEILEILKEGGAITTEKYEELKKKVEEENAKESKKPRVGFKKGFSLETPDGNFKLQPYMKLQEQFKAFEANHPTNNDFYMRTARLGLRGIIYKYFDFNVAGEFGKGSSCLWDGYMGFNYLSEAKLRIGQFKQPFSLEWYSPADWRDFIEMPLPIDNLTPDMDIGAMFHGNLGKEIINYGLGFCNGTGKNTSDTNDDKDIVGRVVFTPFNSSNNPFLKGLHIGGSMAYGNQEAERAEMRRSGKFQTAGETPFFQFNNGILHDGTRARYGGELCYMIGAFSLKGEWVRMNLDDLYHPTDGTKDDFDIDGSYISLSYILTGEYQPFKDGKYGKITPKKNFDPKKGTWGAVQLVARYETLSIDSELLTKGYADSTKYTDEAEGFTLGVNWYLNDLVRAMINYTSTDFNGHIVKDGEKLDSENLFLVRMQVVF